MLNKQGSIGLRLSLLACGVLISLSLSGVANANGGAGGGGGGHGGAGGHIGGGAHISGAGHFVGGGRVAGGYGRFPAGGYRGGWRGYRGGFGGYGVGFGAGLGLGLYFSALPLYYSTYWWGGIPYYYADDTFYTWDGSVGQYQTIDPPPEVEQQAESQANTELIAYPKNGQSDEQQARDKSDCRQWATTQSGYDSAGAAPTADPNRGNYLRAEAACLDARGYSVT
ncbi:MAG TPA: hypothetical protein VK743_21425 [Steroidobacteraceae bacterium]|jgi:hypothetical protein|nr:hypothetical protein [Steroidobacteraceae bacterium]